MLKQLYIKNFTLIDELDIPFFPGFSVITGETGAGKSIILGAIGLLLGNRADARQIKQGQRKCIVEAHFDLSRYGMQDFFEKNDVDYDDECIIRRELSSSGKSRGFINDQPVTVALMRELGEHLIDIHSQHQNLLLQKDDFQLQVVDIVASDGPLLAGYQAAYRKWQEAKRQLKELQTEIAANREKEEFMRFQLQELSQAELSDGEQEQLEKEVSTMSHVEEIKQALFEADGILSAEESGTVEKVREAWSTLQKINGLYPDIQELNQRLDSCYIELKDIAGDIQSHLESVEFDPADYQRKSERLDLLYGLEQKFRKETVAELIAERDSLATQLDRIDNSEEALARCQTLVDSSLAEADKAAASLTEARQHAADKIRKEMEQRLQPLGIPNVRFSIQIDKKELSPDGADKVCFLFSANKSTPMQPVSQVASGGEIARVMLSIKAIISSAVRLPTIIFDEIDTGVSGHVAEKMALIMREMGDNNRQVVSITHLPQIAAMGSHHYKVEKHETPEGTQSRMRLLDKEERITEIAQMLSGSNITNAAIENAKELLK
ncbi:MAG: DNA repair protein RecN [Prevotella sp.]|nr:DNA repair protein RecN [Bacteroidales bacterium]MDY4228574.1 DNA repair protein RecN [Prevotella sp.]